MVQDSRSVAIPARCLPQVFESYDHWSKFDSVLHADNDNVLYVFSAINLKLKGLSMSRAPRVRQIRPRKRVRYRFASHSSFYSEHFAVHTLMDYGGILIIKKE